jgi:hypothetical protein
MYASYPLYLPYPTTLRRGKVPVPNRSSFTWPQAQFAPPYFKPGSASYSPYVYPDGPGITPYGKQFQPSVAFAALGICEKTDDCDCGCSDGPWSGADISGPAKALSLASMLFLGTVGLGGLWLLNKRLG